MARSSSKASTHWIPSICLPVAFSILTVHPAARYFGLSNDGSLLQSSLWQFVVFDTALPGLLPSIAFAFLAYAGTVLAVDACRDVFLQRGFKGRDLLKPGSKDEIPESLGLPACCIYLLALVLFIPFRYYFAAEENWQPPQTTTRDGGWIGDMSGRSGFPHHELGSYLSALLSLLSSQILGFCDDVFDIRWRFKMPIPLISSIPMLLVYYAGRGGTGLVVPGWPVWLRQMVGTNVVDLGILYYVYMAMLSTFCTHSINILAGINGVEVGQALIIAASLCVNDALYLPLRTVLDLSHSPRIEMVPVPPPLTSPSSEASSWLSWLSMTGPAASTVLPPPPTPSFSPVQSELVSRHLFSLSLMLPLVGTCAGLLSWNRHPSLVFVGDTFCYFAGQALACAGVLGHFSKTLLLFFIPQVFNFLLSCPQLFGFVPCPRHRVPKVHPETMALYPSLAVFPAARPAGILGSAMLRILEIPGLVILYRDSESKCILATTNLTILNTILVMSGVHSSEEDVMRYIRVQAAAGTSTTVSPLPSLPHPEGPIITEASLWRKMMGVQLCGSAVAFAVRYWAAAIVFPDQ